MIALQKKIITKKEKNPVAAANVGLQTWVYLKKLMKVLKAETVCDIEHETMYDSQRTSYKLLINKLFP